MKRRGTLAFIIYLLMTLLAIATAVYAYIEAQNIPDDSDSWAGLGAAILLIIALIVGIPYGAELIVKILHMVTGFKLFGVICMLGDLAIFGYFVGSLLAEASSPEMIISELPYLLIFAAPPALAFISNVRSLKN